MNPDLDIDDILRKAVSLGCSDIHIKPGSPPKMRKNGSLVLVPGYESDVLTGPQTDLMSFKTMGAQSLGAFNANGFNHDYSYELSNVGRFRVNVYMTRGLRAFVARLLESTPKSLSELGVPQVISTLAHSKAGIIIVAGATGSGKSTTMAGIINLINQTKPVHIISAEDPIEIIHTDVMASISQREVGLDVESFDSALNSALREDPDVILVGEIRTLETLKTVLRAADTGHLVVTTLHTTDTAETINRILSMYPPNERDETRRALASALRGIIGQRLVPSLDGKNRIPVNEILINTMQMSELILDPAKSAKDIKKLVESSAANGMQSFEQAFIEKVKAKEITLDVAKENSIDPSYYDNINFQAAPAPTTIPKKVTPISRPGTLPTLGKAPVVPAKTPPNSSNPLQRPPSTSHTKRPSNPFA